MSEIKEDEVQEEGEEEEEEEEEEETEEEGQETDEESVPLVGVRTISKFQVQIITPLPQG